MNFQNIDSSWLTILAPEFEKPYFKRIIDKFLYDKAEGKTIFPHESLIFEALTLTPFNEVKVVILGQDPYHGIGEANGLCFSVNEGIKIPPSLRNIYTELANDIEGFKKPNHGDLQKWAMQGILLLNTSLTVIKDEANSHSKIGWHSFTNKIIENISNQKEHIVFILWGKNAHDKMEFINPKTNEYLVANNKKPIDWRL